MKIAIETMTPAKAARILLEKNIDNRKIRESRVDSLVNEWTQGRYILSHQGIAFYRDGVLADGQHRLAAIAKSGVTVQIVVAREMERPENGEVGVRDIIDTGIPRSVADGLTLNHGVKNATMSAAVTRVIIALVVTRRSIVNTVGVTLKVMSIYGDKMEPIMASLRSYKPAMKASIIGSLVFCAKTNKAATFEFAKMLGSGEGLISGMPALALRRALDNHPCYGGGHSLTYAIWVLNALKEYIAGEKMFKIHSGGASLEYFKNLQKANVIELRNLFAITEDQAEETK